MMDGILNINKPVGKTSFSVVASVKRWSGEKRVGHAGTLDPLASGVLPVHLGQATRVVEYLVDTIKTYRAEIELGKITDTYDAEGAVLQLKDISGMTREQIERALTGFHGQIEQVPPAYSAVKQGGKPLYSMARAGISVCRKPRTVRIDRIETVGWDPPVVTVAVDCGKGTYIRSLAYDLGQALGCGAYLKSLVRQRCGVFILEDAVTIDEVELAFRDGTSRQIIHQMDSVLGHIPRVIVNEETARAIRDGKFVQAECDRANDLCRAYTTNNVLVGILKFEEEQDSWHPEKVFRSLDTDTPA